MAIKALAKIIFLWPSISRTHRGKGMKSTFFKLLFFLIALALFTAAIAQNTEQTQTIGVVQTEDSALDNALEESTTELTPQTTEQGIEQAIEEVTDEVPVTNPIITPVMAPLPNTTQAPTETSWWKPTPNTTWQWQISSPYDDGEIETALDVQMYDVDLFDTPQEQIDFLKAKGIKVVCYFSAGTWEDWREDIVQLERRFAGDPKLEQVKGNRMPWPGEWWLNTRHPIVRALMASRLDYAVSRGCDGVEPDNVDAWTNDLSAFPNATEAAHSWAYNIPEWPCEDPPFLDEIETKGTGFQLTANDQLDYNKWMALAAHDRGLSIGLKNNGAQALELEPFYDWSLVESCYNYSECHDYDVFPNNNKPVFMTQYVPDCVLKDGRANSLNSFQSIKPELMEGMNTAVGNMCSDAQQNQFSLIIKRYDLQAWNLQCPN